MIVGTANIGPNEGQKYEFYSETGAYGEVAYNAGPCFICRGRIILGPVLHGYSGAYKVEAHRTCVDVSRK